VARWRFLSSQAVTRAFRAGSRLSRSLSGIWRLASAARLALRQVRAAPQQFRADAGLVIRMLEDVARRRYRRLPVRTLIAAAAGLVYFVNPLDLIPDLLPGLGLLDDAAVLAWIVSLIRKDLDAYRSWAAEWGNAIDVEGYVVDEGHDSGDTSPPLALPPAQR